MILRSEIVAEARRWIGTAFQHQASARGIGTDCGGLIRGVGLMTGGISTADDAEFLALHGGYPREPDGTLRAICDRFLRPQPSTLAPGDVALIRFRREPQHLAIVADYTHGGLSLIHALNSVRRVEEHRLSEQWAARVVGSYCFPGCEP